MNSATARGERTRATKSRTSPITNTLTEKLLVSSIVSCRIPPAAAAITPTMAAMALQNPAERAEERSTSLKLSPVPAGLANYCHLRVSSERIVRNRKTAVTLT